MNKNHKIRFPKYIFRPRLLWIFERDELYVFGAFFMGTEIIFFLTIVVPLLQHIISIIVAVVAMSLYRFYKKDHHIGHAYHFLYFYGLRDPVEKGESSSKSNLHFIPFGFEKKFKE